jgi:hypothetical protein
VWWFVWLRRAELLAAAARNDLEPRTDVTIGTTFKSPTVVPMDPAKRRLNPPGPAGASRKHDTRQLHAMTPGLVGQTIERAGGSRKDTTVVLQP